MERNEVNRATGTNEQRPSDFNSAAAVVTATRDSRDTMTTPTRSNVQDVQRKLTYEEATTSDEFLFIDTEGYACNRLHRRRDEPDDEYQERISIFQNGFEEDELRILAERDAQIAETEARKRFDEALSQTAAEAKEEDDNRARHDGVATEDDNNEDNNNDDNATNVSDEDEQNDETTNITGDETAEDSNAMTDEGTTVPADTENEGEEPTMEEDNDEGAETTDDQKNDSTEAIALTEEATEDEIMETTSLINRHFPRLTGVTRRKYFRRYDLKVTVPPATDANVKLLEQFRSFFKKVKELDVKAFLAPYKADNVNEKAYCHGPDNIPETVSGMRELFDGARPMVKGGTIYVRILMAHDKSFQEIRDDISWSFESDAMGLWERPCQSENTLELGWLLYSLRSMDLDTLKEALEQTLKCAIGLRWRAITTGAKWTPDRKQEDIARAIHIEINEKDQAKAHKPLQEMYSSTRKTGFPLGIMMRLIPGITQLMNPTARVDVQHLAVRQTTFTAQISGATNWEVQTIDRKDPASGKSLREAMMSIQSKSLPHLSVFFSVFPTFKQSSYRFQFLPQLATEAQTAIAGLLPILRHFHGTWVEKYFSPSAIARAQNCTWDPETEQVISPNDAIIGATLASDPDFNFAPETVAIDMQAVHETATGGTNALIKATDSVGTFRTQRKVRKVVKAGTTNSATSGTPTPPANTDSAATPSTAPTTTTASAPRPTPIVGQASASVASSTGSRVSSLQTFQTEITTQVTEQLSSFKTDIMSMMRDMLVIQAGAAKINALEQAQQAQQQQQQQQQQPELQQQQQQQENQSAARQDNTGPDPQVEQPAEKGNSNAGGPSGAAGANLVIGRQATHCSEPTGRWSHVGRGSLEARARMQQHADLTNWLARVANQARAGDWEAWGDYAAPKLPGIIRIMFQNVQNLPSFNEHLKNKVLYGTFLDYQVDVYAMNEVGVHWLNVPEKDRLYHRIQSWFERSEISLAYNSTETPESTFQWGGTAVWSVNKMAHQFMQKGSDDTGLGRWSWQRFRGRNGMALQVVSAYCPQPSGGIYSVPGQHQLYLNKTDDKRSPQEAFWGDLCSAIEAWSAMGDQIILTGDWNEDVRSPSMTARMEQLGLREVLMEKHGSKDAPATGDRGSKPIDGVFASLSLDIARGGYLPFGMGCPSDHRAGWIDVTYEAALGYPMAPLVRPRARRLQNKDPRIVKKYLEYLVAYIIFHKLVEKAVALENTVSYPPTAAQIAEYEKLDKLRLEGIAGAERHCRKLRMGAVPWSPQLKGVWLQLYAWDMVIRKKQGRRISSRFLQRLIAAAGIVVPFEYNLASSKLKRQQVFRHYLKEKPKADATRQTFQDGLADALAEAKDSTKEKQLKQLRLREKQRSAARQSKIVRQKLRAGAVTFVTTVDSTGRKTDVTGKANIERVLNESNFAKYDQTRQTAFMNEPLVTDFNFLGVGDAARKVLDGTYEPPEGTDHYAALFLQHLVQTVDATERDTQATWLDTETWQKSWASGVREHTSSGPSAMHFGSLMAGAQHDLVAELDAIMTNIPLISGYSPTRWCKAIDAMLLKKQGVYLLNKLRTIVLFEPDFNWMNKMLGWTMMTFAESTNQLAPEQYGSRKYHKAIDQVVNKILTFDILRQLRWPGALCSNDAKSCYDRIVHAVASLCMQRNNIAEPAIVCMFSTIQKLEHTIRTAYGDSTSTYTGPLWAIPLQGVMQGNGAGPAIWAIVSSPVLDMLRSEGFGTFFHTSITGEEVRFVGYSFVDDTDLVQTAKGEEDSIASIVELMQDAVNTWEGGIRATGGAIATDKSYWYPIAFIWEKGHWRLATQEETPFEISVLDHTGRRVVLDKLGPDETKETLGTYVAPSGTMEDQMENMLAASKKWADQIRAGRLAGLEDNDLEDPGIPATCPHAHVPAM